MSAHARVAVAFEPRGPLAARADPCRLRQGLDRAIPEEMQRAPPLMLAIKRSADLDKRAGRFLLPVSADLLTLPQVTDSLAGRMEITEPLPPSPWPDLARRYSVV